MSSDDGGPGLTGTGRRHGDGAGRQACAGTAVIEVSHLTKDFCGRTAVADVPFSITSGGVSGFLGPGGAGNVTTVRPPGRGGRAHLQQEVQPVLPHEPGQR